MLIPALAIHPSEAKKKACDSFTGMNLQKPSCKNGDEPLNIAQ